MPKLNTKTQEAGVKELTISELQQLVCLLDYAERDGSYYGRKDYYWKRHESIKSKLQTALSFLKGKPHE